MARNFWKSLPKPFFALAPLEDVTDAAFRRLIAQYGKPHVFYTEFTSADGLVLAGESGKKQLLKKLLFSEVEKPIVAQLFSANPERMEQAAALVSSLGFDGIDINMGCPDRAVEKSRCGAAMIKEPLRAKEIIQAAKRGAGDLPISVKTRIGYAKNELDTWLSAILEEGVAAVAIHARTRNELSDVPARWEHVREAVQIRDALGVDTKIIGNGDVRDLSDARRKADETGCDGVMLGRAIFGNPWLFLDRGDPPQKMERLTALLQHLQLFEDLLGDTASYSTMKKHFKAYVNGWRDAKEFRMRLMNTETIEGATALLAYELKRESEPALVESC